jgi:hypothetical protein
MNQNEAVAAVAAVLTTLAETDGGPESSCYLALGGKLESWEMIKFIMTRAGWITTRAHWVELTDAGKSKVREIEAALARK